MLRRVKQYDRQIDDLSRMWTFQTEILLLKTIEKPKIQKPEIWVYLCSVCLIFVFYLISCICFRLYITQNTNCDIPIYFAILDLVVRTGASYLYGHNLYVYMFIPKTRNCPFRQLAYRVNIYFSAFSLVHGMEPSFSLVQSFRKPVFGFNILKLI